MNIGTRKRRTTPTKHPTQDKKMIIDVSYSSSSDASSLSVPDSGDEVLSSVEIVGMSSPGSLLFCTFFSSKKNISNQNFVSLKSPTLSSNHKKKFDAKLYL